MLTTKQHYVVNLATNGHKDYPVYFQAIFMKTSEV